MICFIVIAAVATVLVDGPPARLVPPAPPEDLAAVLAADPSKDGAMAKRMLVENGVPAELRMRAAKSLGASPVLVLLDAIAQCGGTCGATRDLAGVLVSLAAEAAKDPVVLERLTKCAQTPENPAYSAALRTIAAMPAEQRPEALRGVTVRPVAIGTIPGAMQYDLKEIKAKPGEILEITLKNTDTMQHNLLIVMPGKMSEVGVAADKMGDTPEGKACQFVPDMPSVLAVMGLIDPDKSGSLFYVVPQKPGTYQYVCTVPGHWRMMNGKLKVAP
jgi:azurin